MVSSWTSKALQNASMASRLLAAASGVWLVTSKLSTNVHKLADGSARATHSNRAKLIKNIEQTLNGSPSGKPVVDLMAGPVPPVMTNRLSRPVIERNQACKSVAGSRMCLAIAKTGIRGRQL